MGGAAQWCQKCRRSYENQHGEGEVGCAQPGGVCLYPVPRLAPDEGVALEVFRMTPWLSGMGGREGLSFRDAESISRALGVDWDGDLLELLRACESEILKGDAQARAARDTSGPGGFAWN